MPPRIEGTIPRKCSAARFGIIRRAYNPAGQPGVHLQASTVEFVVSYAVKHLKGESILIHEQIDVSQPLGFAPDPGLSQRDILLNTRQMALHLGAELSIAQTGHPCELMNVRIARATYRFAKDLRVLYQFEVNKQWHAVHARTFPAGTSKAVYERAREAAVTGDILRPIAHSGSLDAVFWTFPNDRKISKLTVLTDGHGPYASLLGGCWDSTRLITWSPERAATAQCLNSAGKVLAYAKVYANDDGLRSYQIHNDLCRELGERDTYLRLPHALAYDDTSRLLLLEPIAGQNYAELEDRTLQTAIQGFGAALARLHMLSPPRIATPVKGWDQAALEKAARVISQARPDVAQSAMALCDELIAKTPASMAAPVCLHGDVNFKNWIAMDKGVALIDLEAIATGDAAIDLGGVLAGLWYRRCLGHFSETLGQQLAIGFLRGYASVRALPKTSVILRYTATALFAERTYRSVTRVRPDGLAVLQNLLDDAYTLIKNNTVSDELRSWLY